MPFPLPAPMRLALSLAADAAGMGEVPVGAVVTYKGIVVATAANSMRRDRDPTNHAEMLAIRRACIVLERERLTDCDLWVTLEPCAMCAGAVANARIARLFYGANDPKGGAVTHGARIFSQSTCHHRPEIFCGLGEARSAEMLRTFFTDRRRDGPEPAIQF